MKLNIQGNGFRHVNNFISHTVTIKSAKDLTLLHYAIFIIFHSFGFVFQIADFKQFEIKNN